MSFIKGKPKIGAECCQETMSPARYEYYYITSQYHLLTGEGGKLANVFATPANFLYARKIMVLDNVTVDKLVVEVTAAVAGSAVAGVYSIDEDGFPGKLLFQTGIEFNLGVTGIQEVTLNNKYNLDAGSYAVVYHGSSAATMRTISRPVPTWGQSKTLIQGENSWIVESLPYSSTLPTTFPSSTVSTSVAQATAVLFNLV